MAICMLLMDEFLPNPAGHGLRDKSIWYLSPIEWYGLYQMSLNAETNLERLES